MTSEGDLNGTYNTEALIGKPEGEGDILNLIPEKSIAPSKDSVGLN